MPISDITPFSLTDYGLNASSNNSIPISAGPGKVPTFTAPGGVRSVLMAPYRAEVVSVDDPQYGVVGDGSADDTVALRAVLATGKSIRLNPAKTYVISGALTIGSGQVIQGQSATIKRAAQISSTFDAGAQHITAGVTTSVTVANASAFKVGMDINIVDATGLIFDDNQNHTITAINGNTITFQNAFDNTNPFNGPSHQSITSGTATVYTSVIMLVLGDNAAVHDVVLDGNRANVSWAYWNNTIGCQLYNGTNALASHVRSLNEAGEAFMIESSSYGTLFDCYADSPNGNGVHLAGSTHPKMIGCTILNPNQNQAIGHVMGCIGWSNSIVDATVIGCYLYGGVAGIGKIDTSDNSDVTITGCTIRGTTAGTGTVATVAGIDLLDGTASNTPSRIVISDCRIYTCQYGIRISETQATTTYPNYITITGCHLEGNTSGNILLNQSQFITITGCQFHSTTTTIMHVDIESCQWVNVSGCVFDGGGYGVYAEPSTATGPDCLNVSGNVFHNQHAVAVRFQDGVLNSTIANNVIESTDATNTTYTGVLCYGPTLVQANQISLAVSGQVGINPNNGTATGKLYGAAVLNNRINGTATAGIQTFGGNGWSVIAGNICPTTAPISDGAGICTALARIHYSGTISGGALTTGTGSTTIDAAGSGYANATQPIIFVGGAGSGAAGTATISGGAVTSVNITAGGSGYTGTPNMYVSGNVDQNNVTA